jgi:hypothetical protein
MAAKKTVTMENLQALGVERLAGILMGLAWESADIKRRLRLELAANEGGDIIAGEVGKRLASLRSSRSFVDWQKRPALVKDLELQRSLIVERIGASRPDLALDLMWRFLELAAPVFNRVDDSNGSVGDIFRGACEDLGTLALAARPDPEAFAKRVFTALQANDYGVYDHLVEVAFPALGDEGVRYLRTGWPMRWQNGRRKTGSGIGGRMRSAGRCRTLPTGKGISTGTSRWCRRRTGANRALRRPWRGASLPPAGQPKRWRCWRRQSLNKLPFLKE